MQETKQNYKYPSNETGLILFFSDGFDIVVNDCFAHNGANKKIQLIDHHGCPVDDKLIR